MPKLLGQFKRALKFLDMSVTTLKSIRVLKPATYMNAKSNPPEFHEIGIIRRGARVCGIAHYSSFRKTDVTRFFGTISGNLAEIEFSSSHDQEKVATGTIVLTPKSAKWRPKTVGWSGGGGYHSSPFMAHRAQKPGEKESYVVDAKRECEEFLSNGKPLDKLGWDF